MIEKIKAFSWKDVMRYRNEIFGIAAIWILFFHIHNYVGGSSFLPLKMIFRVVSKGNMGVDIFLFLSAIGIYASAQKNSVSDFYANRIKRVLIPYLIMSTLYFVWYNFFEASRGIWGFLGDVTTVNFWLLPDYPVWYVAFIIIAYALFPLIYKLDVKTKHISTVCLIVVSVIGEYLLYVSDSWLFDNAERAFSRIPVFLFGVLLAPRILKGNRIDLWKVALLSALGGGLFVIICLKSFDIVITRYIYGVIGICAIVVYGFFRELVNIKLLGKILLWFGGISFEIYILHVLLIRIVRYNEWWGLIPRVLWYIVIPLISVALAKAVSMLCDYIYSKRKPILTKRG